MHQSINSITMCVYCFENVEREKKKVTQTAEAGGESSHQEGGLIINTIKRPTLDQNILGELLQSRFM